MLRHELQSLIRSSNIDNIIIPEWSEATMWGGASLLQMHLKVFQELLDMKLANKWNWDYVINLSESDFPIKLVFKNV